MNPGRNIPEIGADDFSRRFSLRAARLMWLLGAGASASAGIPTAWDLAWEFKQLLFVSQRRASSQSVSDLANPAIRAQLQTHIDGLGQLPTMGSPDEYAALFEAAFPAEADRRTFLDSKVAAAKPSYGHIALATLMRAGLVRVVWTTNFDALIPDACARVFDGTGALTTITLDTADTAAQTLNEGRWPLEIKLHGDFRSRRLKNTSDELRHQDGRLRENLVRSCNQFGLVVVGYSGRDNSVMDALDEAVSGASPFPAGLFWLQREGDTPLPRVERLLNKAVDTNVEAVLVRVENFDEVVRDLTRLIGGLDTTALDMFAIQRRPWTAVPRPTGGRGWPGIRLNALRVIRAPTVCRRVVCDVGGYRAAREAVQRAQVTVLVARSKAGVLAYGSDAAVQTAFGPHGIKAFDIHSIGPGRLRYESAERGLMREALTRALAEHRGLTAARRASSDFLTPSDPADAKWAPLRNLVGVIDGAVPGHPELIWREGISTRLECADDHLWLVVDPCTGFEGVHEENKAFAADFARERTVRRYNRELNGLLLFWANCLAGNGDELRALGITDGIDASFCLSADLALSLRAGHA